MSDYDREEAELLLGIAYENAGGTTRTGFEWFKKGYDAGYERAKEGPTLDELLDRVTPENRHDEVFVQDCPHGNVIGSCAHCVLEKRRRGTHPR